MKVVLIGVGQAGGKVAQALAEHDYEMNFGAVQGGIAVNTAKPDLQSMKLDTVLVGQDRVKGHGVGGDNELGAEIMDAETTEVMGALEGTLTSKAEAITIVAGLGGGTGSGGAPVLARELRAVYDIPVYVIGILPGRNEGSLYQANAGRSLKTVTREADASLLIDNDAWHDADESVEEGYDAINDAICQRVGLLLASGEMVDGVGESVVDSSEIINTLKPGGMAALGYASAKASEDAGENVNTITSVTRNALLTSMSVPNVVKAETALLVIAGDPERISRKGVERARSWLEDETGSLEVRGGDFPLDSERVGALVLLGGIERSNRIDEFMDRARQANEQNQQVERTDHTSEFQNDELDDLF